MKLTADDRFKMLLIELAILTLIALEWELIFHLQWSLPKLLLTNCCVATVFGIIFVFLLPNHLQKNLVSLAALFVVVGIFVPALGILAVGVGTLFAYGANLPNLNVKAIKTWPPSEFAILTTNIADRNLPGEIWDIVHGKAAPISERLKTLALLNISKSDAINMLNRGMLYQQSDELRLYAFSLLDNQETDINHEISKTLPLLEQAKSPLFKARVEKHLAFLYWLLVDFKLVEKDLLEFTLNRSLNYATSALKTMNDHASLWLLLGRIYTMKNDRPRALDALNHAMRLNASDRNLLPYLAEWSFKKRNFEELRRYFVTSTIIQNLPVMSEIVAFWNK